MARRRVLSPEFFTSKTVTAWPYRTRLTFQGLWIYCDDYGRGEDDLQLIVVQVWPRDDDVNEKEVDEDLSILVEAGVVCRYTVGGGRFLHVTNWSEHQQVSHPKPIRVPPCPICQVDTYRGWYRGHDLKTDRWRRFEKAARAAQIDSRWSPEACRTTAGTPPP